MDKVDISIRNLRALVNEHNEMGMRIMKAAGGKVYPVDLVAVAVLNRSAGLLVGFCDLLEKHNFVAAAPLLRLQLDNLLRFHAIWLVDKPHDLASAVVAGKPIGKMKDRDGEKMTDGYLVKKISKEYPALSNVYKHTSGYIHLSDKHIFNSMTAGKTVDGFNMKVSAVDGFISEDTYIEALQAFAEITMILFRYLQGWAVTKDGPVPDKK